MRQLAVIIYEALEKVYLPVFDSSFITGAAVIEVDAVVVEMDVGVVGSDSKTRYRHFIIVWYVLKDRGGNVGKLYSS